MSIGQYIPCPKKTLNTAQIDSQFFGGQGDLSSGDYSYKMTGGCSDFNALALTSNPKAKCFKVDSSRTISTITCPKAVTKVGNCTIKSGTRISGGSTGKVVSCPKGRLQITGKKKTMVLNQVEVLLSGHVQVRNIIRVMSNGKIISETFHRHVLSPGDNLSKEDPRVVAIAKAAWKPERMKNFKSNSKNKIIKKHRFK